MKWLNKNVIYNYFSVGIGRAAALQMRVVTAMNLLVEEKRRGGRITAVEEKKFEPRNDLEKLEDYGASPGKSFWQHLENATNAN